MPAPRNTLQPVPDKWDAFYCRLSRDDDNEGDSNSIQHQKQILERYARDHGITQYRYYVDDGYSGTNFNRPGFKEMLADIEAGHVRTVIVKDMSRFGRNYLEVGMFTEIRFPELDVRFIAINDGIDSVQGENDFAPLRNLFNEWYARDTSKKIRAVVRTKGLAGERTSTKVPYGYLLGENKRLIVDEETAPVVHMIFQLCAEGNGPGKIARILRERRIPTPGTIAFHRKGQTSNYHPEEPCGWTTQTVSSMLKLKEYLGHTVNFKTAKKNFKSKHSTINPEENQAVFENTHEAIIDQELWDVVQKIRSQRHRPTRTGEIALFSGMMFCADCGSPLTLLRHRDNGVVKDNYICSKYRTGWGTKKCEAHYIQVTVLKELVLDNLRHVIAFARDFESEFVQQVTDNVLAEQMKQQSTIKRQLEQQERRIAEIDVIIQRLYEDMVSGKLADERFAKMGAAYEQEQKELVENSAGLKKTFVSCENQKANINSFLRLVKSYIEPQELTPEILHMFIEKIVVHSPDRSSGQRIQQVDIYYNFVGQFDMSVERRKSRRRTKDEINAQIMTNS